MSEQQSQFLPEHVDEQVEALSQAQMGTKHGRSASARLVAHLHQAYQEETEIGEQVWARLARYAGERQGSGALSPERSASAPSSPNAASSQRIPMNQHRLFSIHSGETSSMSPLDQQSTQSLPLLSEPGPLQQEAMLRFGRMSSTQGGSTPGKRMSRFFGLVAAMVVGAVLISSMALVFTMMKGRIPNTGTGPSVSPTTVKATPTTATSSVPPECRDVQDMGEETLCAQHEETMLTLTKTFSGHEVTFVRAYADPARLILIYTTKDSPQSDVISFMSVTIQQGITLSSGSGRSYENPATHQWYYLVNFETRAIPAGTTTLHIQGIVDGLSSASTPLSFTIPFHAAQKTVAVHQTRTSHGIALTLDHLVLTESMATAYFTSSSSAQYSLFVHALSINGQQLASINAGSSGYGKGSSPFVMRFHQSLLNQPGTWVIPVHQLLLGASSQVSWTFSFTVQA